MLINNKLTYKCIPPIFVILKILRFDSQHFVVALDASRRGLGLRSRKNRGVRERRSVVGFCGTPRGGVVEDWRRTLDF